MAALIRAHDWASTPLGATEGWPVALRTVIDMTLVSPLVSTVAVGAARILIYNDAAARLYGDRHPQALGRPLAETWPEAYAEVAHLYDRAFAGEAVHVPAQPLDVSRKGGEVFDVYLTPLRNTDLRNTDGAVLAVQMTGFEVGERTRVETRQVEAARSQKAERERMAAMFEQAPGFMAMLRGPDHVFELANAAYRQLVSHRDVIDRPVGEAVPEAKAQGFVDLLDRVYATGEPFVGRGAPISLQPTPGAPVEERILDFVYQPITDTDGAVTGIFVEGADVTEQARQNAALRVSEARYRTLFERMDQGYCLIDMIFDEGGRATDYRFVEANPTFEHQSGLKGAVGRRIREFAPELEEHWFERYGRVALTGEAMGIEGEVAPLDRWFDINAFRVGAPEQRRVGVLFTDITVRRKAEVARRESEARQAFLLRLSDTLTPMADALEIEHAATRLTRETLGASRVFYAAIEADGDTGVIRNEAVDGVASAAGRHSIRAFGPTLAEDWLAGRVTVIRDVNADPLYSDEQRAAHAAVSSRATIAVPLVKAGALVAVVIVSQATPRDWTEAEVQLVSDTANRIWDASQRARAEAVLRDSEERLRAILETARDYAILTTDTKGRVETWSKGAEAVLGWTADEIVGQMMDAAFTPEDRANGVPELERRTARDEGQAPDVRWHLRSDGSRVFIEGAVRPIAGPDGSLRGYVKVGQDVTEKRATQERLRASEALFRQFSEGSTDVIWIRDAGSMQFEYVSPAFEVTYGECVDRLLAGNDLRNWVRLILPADRRNALDAFRRVRNGERVTHEFRIRRASDSEERWIRDTTFPLTDEAGRIERVAGIGQDVTDMKRAEAAVVESEARLRTLTEGIPQLVWRTSDYGMSSWVSPQWTAFTGQSEVASHGWGWIDTLHPDDRQATRDAWERAKTSDTFEAEFRLREAATGDHRWFQSRALQVRDEAGRLVEWLGTSTDVEDLREMQGRLRVLVAELQHRTRNLLGVVLGVMRRTRRGSKDPLRFATDFQSRVEALARVQGHLSRLDEGARIDFDELLRAELGAIGALDEGRWGARVTLEGPQGVRLRSSTVQTFALALHELATNAAKYGALSQRGGRLAVRWFRVQDSASPRLRVEWTESDVTMPTPDTPAQGSGYGRELIEQALPYQLGAETTFELGADGVRCTITLPLSSTTEDAHA